ncbi:hypothetical protein O5154_28985, partial [Escherichia coli]|nr:hypothetical protein [Escherichia coli]
NLSPAPPNAVAKGESKRSIAALASESDFPVGRLNENDKREPGKLSELKFGLECGGRWNISPT